MQTSSSDLRPMLTCPDSVELTSDTWDLIALMQGMVTRLVQKILIGVASASLILKLLLTLIPASQQELAEVTRNNEARLSHRNQVRLFQLRHKNDLRSQYVFEPVFDYAEHGFKPAEEVASNRIAPKHIDRSQHVAAAIKVIDLITPPGSPLQSSSQQAAHVGSSHSSSFSGKSSSSGDAQRRIGRIDLDHAGMPFPPKKGLYGLWD